MTFKNEDKTAENLAQNLESPFEDCEYHNRIKDHAKDLCRVGFHGAVYNYQCGESTFWTSPSGDVSVRVKNGAILY